mmetsp:Transcript_10117/g.20124  ORF Transcript_10117/g.20124 Transcript_10117/m.20124 type:complete len:113 (+) Transcript_10117:269-607(+)
MLRYQRLLCLISPPLLAWFHFVGRQIPLMSLPSVIFNCFLNIVPFLTPYNVHPWRDCVLYLSPLIALALLAVYAVSDIAFTVLTFNDCKEAAAEIDKQVVEARKEMKKRGIK